MSVGLAIAGLVLATLFSSLLAVLNYTLRDLSRSRLKDALERRKRVDLLEPTIERADDLAFMSASGRLLCNLLVLLMLVALLERTGYSDFARYGLALATSVLVLLIFSLALPMPIALHRGEQLVARAAPLLHALWPVFRPVARLMHTADRIVRSTSTETPADTVRLAEEIDEQIIEAVEEGARSGLVDERQRRLIERALAFDDTTAQDAMTDRNDIVALPDDAKLSDARALITTSGHSRIPVYHESLDNIVGVLYARDLLPLWGAGDDVDLLAMLRRPLDVPHSLSLRSLLHEFRIQKVHIAIVHDEHGGVDGLITIEDVMEELVGDISDEHEKNEPPMFTRVAPDAIEADGRTPIEQLNDLLGLTLPTDMEFSTLGGFVSHEFGRIPEVGDTIEVGLCRFTILEASPMRVDRVHLRVLSGAEREAAASNAAT